MMKSLHSLIPQNLILHQEGENLPIEELCFDSRKAKNGSLFFAIPGTKVDGHDFIQQVMEAGCQAIVLEKIPEIPVGMAIIQVKDSAEAMGHAASLFFDEPSKKIKLIGITGTNGKTTTVTLLFNLFKNLGFKSGLLSTIENKIQDTIIPATHTTPDAIQLNQLLNRMVEEDCEYAFMEVSSHSVVQHRISGLNFTGAIFSNITRDHLDFHGTFDNYIKAKKGFFDQLSSKAWALVNIDDKNGKVMLQNTRAKKNHFSFFYPAEFKGKLKNNSLEGLELDFDGASFHARLIGEFNAYNLLAIYSTARLMGIPKEDLLIELSRLGNAPGRFELIRGNSLMAIVDYAHTPDALENVLKTIKAVKGKNQRVLTLVGCGGNRDKGKRPMMAKIACQYSDFSVFTSDNPRNEDPDQILLDMVQGLDKKELTKVKKIVDRGEAIQWAIQVWAEKNDLVLVAGKGHEDYQIIQGEKILFDDREEVRKFLLTD